MTPAQRRAVVARRDPVKVREQDRRKMARRRRFGTPAQKQRIAARAAVWRALKQGLLVRGRCRCGSGDVEAHHPDHARPLDVVWLCRSCHRNLHKDEQLEDAQVAGPAPQRIAA